MPKYYQTFISNDYQNFSLNDYQGFEVSINTLTSSGFTVIENPSIYSKSSPGSGDIGILNTVDSLGNDYSVYKFLGASLLGITVNVGYNGTASSATVTLVEDKQNGDTFIQPTMPSLWAISLPSGGVGAPILYPNGFNLQPNALEPTNCPFYFCGFVNQWRIIEEDVGGKTISCSIVDPREVLQGVQCILGSYALSQNIGDGNPRFTGVNNFIDCFGYYNYGFESGRNAYGMPWYNIMNVIQNSRVTINGMNFEFWFSGDAFLDVPYWYRIEDNLIDLVGLCLKVCQDGGADFIVRAVKVDPFTAVVELRGIKRANTDPLTKFDIVNFVSARSSITEHVQVGTEYRNEPTSNVVVGGLRNTNYVAWPTDYASGIHLSDFGPGLALEDYSVFQPDIKLRLFSGSGTIDKADILGNDVVETTLNYNNNTGAIFPFWGYASLSGQDPLVEPFLSLEHLVFSRNDDQYASLTYNIPYCRVDLQFYPVRQVPHQDVFLDGDGDSDFRPFGYLSDIKLGYEGPNLSGYMRGLPLNTEILRAALISEEMFYFIYNMYYPEVAAGMSMRGPDWAPLNSLLLLEGSAGTPIKIQDVDPTVYITSAYPVGGVIAVVSNSFADAVGKINKTHFSAAEIDITAYAQGSLQQFNKIIYNEVQKYADEYCGKQFVVCLPRSETMQRIWNNLPVPTNVNRPEIEYIVDDSGFWEYVPTIFDGVGNAGASSGTFTSQQEQQIVRRFSGIDGRFTAMVAMDWHPSGNVCFSSNGLARAMFQDIPVDDFRPNQIADGNPDYVFIVPSIEQGVKRPDLAMVTLPAVVSFDNLDIINLLPGYTPPDGARDIGADAQSVISRFGIMKFLQSQMMTSNDFRNAIETSAIDQSISFSDCYTLLVNSWCKQIYNKMEGQYRINFDHERIMDLKSVVIPITSNWVRYGPWYSTSDDAPGMVKIDIDDSLVPWNFIRPPTSLGWDYNLNLAGEEKLTRSLQVVDYVDSAVINCAGFPEMGIGVPFGFNSNITTINIDFGIGGIKTTYNMATYAYRPGTYRKSDYDNVVKGRIDNRPKILNPINNNVFIDQFPTLSVDRYPD